MPRSRRQDRPKHVEREPPRQTQLWRQDRLGLCQSSYLLTLAPQDTSASLPWIQILLSHPMCQRHLRICQASSNLVGMLYQGQQPRTCRQLIAERQMLATLGWSHPLQGDTLLLYEASGFSSCGMFVNDVSSSIAKPRLSAKAAGQCAHLSAQASSHLTVW